MTEENLRETPVSADAGSQETEQLKADIERSRAELSSTIGELETRLSPPQLRNVMRSELEHIEERVRATVKDELGEARKAVHDGLEEAEAKIRRGVSDAKSAIKQDVSDALTHAKQAVRDATLGRVEDFATSIGDKMNQTRDTLVETVRQNPIPAAMMGAGLLWLLMSRSKSASDAVARAKSVAGDTTQKWSDATSRRVHDASDAVGSALHGASESASELVHRAKDTAQHWVEGAEATASSVVDDARRGVQQAERGLQSTYRENPLALGAAALALGTVAGLALPRTAREDELLGEARDSVLRKAGEAAHQAVASASQLAESARGNLKQGEGAESGASA